MPAKKEYTAEFKEQSVRFVFEHIEVDESRYGACQRLGPKLNVKPVTLYNWVKIATPKPLKPASASGSVEDLKAQLAQVRKENRELARANQILQDAATFFGAALDRRSQK
jgi:transposase